MPLDLTELTKALVPKPYVVAFLDQCPDSQRVKRLLDRMQLPIQQLPVRKHSEDIPRIVTEEHIYCGYAEIKQYCLYR